MQPIPAATPAPTPAPTPALTRRAIAILRAVAANRAELTLRCGPNLRIDGLPCCDQLTARTLATAGLVRPARPHPPGSWVRAELTPQGWDGLRAAA